MDFKLPTAEKLKKIMKKDKNPNNKVFSPQKGGCRTSVGRSIDSQRGSTSETQRLDPGKSNSGEVFC
jgi:hypothetical protein